MIRLPNELLAMIITLLADPTLPRTKGALHAISLVSWRLRAIVLPYLFRATRVTCKKSLDTIQAFRTFLLGHPRIAQHVQELRLSGSRRAWRNGPVATNLPIAQLKTILDSLPRLRKLQIDHIIFVLQPMPTPTPALAAAADVSARPSRELSTLHLFAVGLSPYIFQHVLALFTRVERIDLVRIYPLTNEPAYAPTRGDEQVYPPLLPVVKHVRTEDVYSFASYLMPFADEHAYVEPVTRFAFAFSEALEVRGLARYLKERGGGVERLELGFADLEFDLWEDTPNLPGPFEQLKSSFASCTALTRIHMCMYIPNSARSYRTTFVKAVGALAGLPPHALKHLVLELIGVEHVGKTAWAKLAAVCARFENLKGVGLMNDATGAPAELSKGLRAKLEGLGVKVVPVWRESE